MEMTLSSEYIFILGSTEQYLGVFHPRLKKNIINVFTKHKFNISFPIKRGVQNTINCNNITNYGTVFTIMIHLKNDFVNS